MEVDTRTHTRVVVGEDVQVVERMLLARLAVAAGAEEARGDRALHLMERVVEAPALRLAELGTPKRT